MMTPANLHPDIARVLFTAEEIDARVRLLAQRISMDYAGVSRLYLIGILKGAFIFMADLCRQLTVPHSVDFIAVSSYGKAAASGAVRLVMDVREPIGDQHVLIVEDIVDTGNTLRYLYHALEGRGPASLRTCAFCRKQRPDNDFPIDYLGVEIPDVWVVGYGLDYADRHRTLPYIAELKPEVYQ
jgi:hypoxanthine phosphoribosyltransferase